MHLSGRFRSFTSIWHPQFRSSDTQVESSALEIQVVWETAGELCVLPPRFPLAARLGSNRLLGGILAIPAEKVCTTFLTCGWYCWPCYGDSRELFNFGGLELRTPTWCSF